MGSFIPFSEMAFSVRDPVFNATFPKTLIRGFAHKIFLKVFPRIALHFPPLPFPPPRLVSPTKKFSKKNLISTFFIRKFIEKILKAIRLIFFKFLQKSLKI